MLTIMLDVDGVLVHGRRTDGRPWFADLENDLGLPFEILARAFFADRWPDIVIGKKPLLPELASALQAIARDITPETLMDYWFSNDSRIDRAVLDAVSVLRGRGHRVYLATNQEHMRARYLMKNMQLESCVDGILYSAALGFRKPMTEFYERVTETVAVPKSDILLIDDTKENIDAARLFGWRALHWDKGGRLVDMLDALG